MNSSNFVTALKMVASKGATTGVFASLENPPGRRPNPDFVRLGHWLRALTPEDRQCVQEIAGLAAEQATYNTLLVLDGLLAVESSLEKGEFELWFKKGDETIRLNSPTSVALSSLFKSVGSPQS